MPHVRAIFFVVVFFCGRTWVLFFIRWEKKKKQQLGECRQDTHIFCGTKSHTYTHCGTLINYLLRVYTFFPLITHTHTQNVTLCSRFTHIFTHLSFSHSSFCPHTLPLTHTRTFYASIFSILQCEHTLTCSTSHFLRSPPLTHMNTIVCRLLSAAGRSCGEESCGRAEDGDDLCRFQGLAYQRSVKTPVPLREYQVRRPDRCTASGFLQIKPD